MEIIDSHHHLWRYKRDEFDWIGEGMESLQRDFLFDDLSTVMHSASVDATVVVQARQSLEETRWLLDLARDSEGAIQGVVGWVPLADPAVVGLLKELAGQPLLKAVRHVIQDEPDDDFLLRDDFNRGVASLSNYGFVYDLLIHARHLPQACRFARMHPNQVIVLDHLAKPPIASQALQPWTDNLRRLADSPNVFCKVSGLVTEANWRSWTFEDLQPYLNLAFDAFGVERLMAGSDWPVCLLATEYRRWWSTVFTWLAPMTHEAQTHISGSNARRVYKLGLGSVSPDEAKPRSQVLVEKPF